MSIFQEAGLKLCKAAALNQAWGAGILKMPSDRVELVDSERSIGFVSRYPRIVARLS